MFDQAHLVPINPADHPEDPNNQMLVWSGHLTKLITSELNYSTPLYTRITKALKRMGCINQLRRGGGNAESQWQLNFEPTEELYMGAIEKKAPAQGKVPQLEQQVRSLTRRMNELEQAVHALTQGLSKEDADG